MTAATAIPTTLPAHRTPADERAHAVKLFGIGIDISFAQFVDPHGGRADEASDIWRHAFLLQKL